MMCKKLPTQNKYTETEMDYIVDNDIVLYQNILYNNNSKKKLEIEVNNKLLFDIILNNIIQVRKSFKIENLVIRRIKNYDIELIYDLTEMNINNKIICLDNFIKKLIINLKAANYFFSNKYI